MTRSEAPPTSLLETKLFDSRKNIYIESIHGPAAAAGFGDGVELGVLDRDVPEAGAQHLSTNHSSVLQIPTNQRSVITYHF